MKFLDSLAVFAMFCIPQTDAVPDRFYQIRFLPGAQITRYESTMIIPASSPTKDHWANIQAAWPGLLPENGRAVLQNVVTNQGGRAGEWYLLPFYCCDPGGQLVDQMKVHPGEAVTTLFVLDAMNGLYVDSWVVHSGASPGVKPTAGFYLFDINNYPTINYGPYQQATLSIELQHYAVWDFGPVVWQNIILVASTTSVDWCIEPEPDPGFRWSMTPPIATVDEAAGSTTCYIAKVVLEGLE